MRKFETGATRSDDSSRPMYTGYLSSVVLERFGEYMTRHRLQEDGSLRAPDNWQKGMPKESYREGLWRHFLAAWIRLDGYEPHDPKCEPSLEDDLCAIIFNAQGMLRALLLEKRK